VIPAACSYVRAESAADAVALLGEYGDDAKLLAGGHSLLPLMKLRLATPSVLVDVGRVHELAYVRDRGDHLAVGGLTRHHELETNALVRDTAPLLAAAAGRVGDPQVRHRGTLGGSLAHGDPASDLPAVVLALRGTVVAQGPDGTRELTADDFFVDFLETALAPDEVITEIRIPKIVVGGWGFEKFSRRAQDWAIVGAAVVGGDQPGVALVNMGVRPLRARAVEAAWQSGATPAEAAALAAEGTEPTTDLNASAEYRRHLARVLVERALTAAVEPPDARGEVR
jgi:carbon-monoxide dehydrogenase medium subunit